MSETITITIEGGNTVQKIPHDTKRSILETLIQNGMGTGSFCKGLSRCGRCRIRFLKGAPLPVTEDRKYFEAALLREGYRLACRAKPKRDCTIAICFEKEPDMQIVTGKTGDGLGIMERTGRESDTKSDINGSAGRSAGRHPRTFAAADIGTTTVVMQLADIVTGETLSTVKFMNPQRCYGLDVLSRIQAAVGHGRDMRRRITEALIQGIKELQKTDNGTKEPSSELFAPPELLCVTGNTAMLHILMGYDTTGLGKSPFTPVSVQEELTVLGGVRTLVMPSLSAFVGADAAADILETGMQETEGISLLIDLGTNGEMALGNKDRLLACAAAAGPAFEGGAERGIYGADILAAIAFLLDEGKIGESGYMEKPQSYEYRGKQVGITLEKIREIQLAKAAIRAGIELLIKKYGLASYDGIDRVYLAGGFGYFLSEHAAARTGLLPKELLEKTKAVGNSALAGALNYGRDFLLNGSKDFLNRPEKNGRILLNTEKIESFNLAEEEEFEEIYLRYIDFPKWEK